MPLTLSAAIKIAAKLASILYASSQDSPLKKIAQNEYAMAICDLRNANEESHIREALTRALTHLESAYVNYIPCITTWDIWNQYSALYSKRSFANSMCIYIAILHYTLGNTSISKKWLFSMDTDGEICFPTDILPMLSIQDEDTFYKIVCGTDYSDLKGMIETSEQKYKSDSYWKDPDNWGGYGPGCESLYSG